MKRIFFSLVYLLVTSLLVAQSSNLQVVYDYKAKLSHTDPKLMANEKMILSLSDAASDYVSAASQNRKMMISEAEKTRNLDLRNAPKSIIKHRVFKNRSANELIFFDNLGVYQYYYTQASPKFSWNITNETKSILNYNCTKATTTFEGRDYTAWYTTDIPISDGPYKFCGLPGLILAISDSKEEYQFTATEIIKEDAKIALDINNNFHKKVKDRKEFLALKKKSIENPNIFLQHDQLTLPAEMIEKAANNYLRFMTKLDNPIELE